MLAVLAVTGFEILPAKAAKKATIEIEEVQIHETSDAASPVLEVLHKGDSISVSNNPVNGFHKARGPSGAIGWIDANQLNLTGEPKGDAESVKTEVAATPSSSRSSKNSKKIAKPWSIRGFGGLTLSSPTVAATPFSTNPISYLMQFGVSASYQILEWLGIETRVEYLTRSRSFIASSVTYIDTLSSLPIVVGPVIRVLNTPRFEFRLGALGGVAPMTSFTFTSGAATTANTTVYSGLGYAFTGKVDGAFKVTPTFGVFAEAGYRILTTASVAPSPAGTGSELYTSSGNLVSLPVNYSGIFFGGGVALFF